MSQLQCHVLVNYFAGEKDIEFMFLDYPGTQVTDIEFICLDYPEMDI
jgi:hypothetical protein